MIDKKFLGVCAWLSEKFEFDVTGVRLLFVVATVLGFGSPVFLFHIISSKAKIIINE
jgi:phage shock protein C